MEERLTFINDTDINTTVGTSKLADNTRKRTQWNDWATARNSHQNNSQLPPIPLMEDVIKTVSETQFMRNFIFETRNRNGMPSYNTKKFICDKCWFPALS